MIVSEDIVTELNNILLTEGRETKNMSAAKHYLYDKMGYDEKQAMNVIGQIKHDMPNSRLDKCKFMLGLVRMYCNGEINNGNIITKLNQTLEYVASDKYINNFNQDLNGLSCSELISQFEGIISQDIALRKDKMSQEQHTANNLYNIVKIDSFKEAKKYSRYCDWCVTQEAEAFEDYGGDLVNQFYFCLRNGFKKEKAIIGDGCPLDSYGLSMIAVSIRPDGSINTCTCRWNHDNGGNDHIMNDEQLSKLLGVNIYEVLKPKEVDIISLIEKGGRSLESIAVGNFVIPDGVKCIGNEAFGGCEGLTSITIPSSVTSVGYYAFSDCSGLTSITIPNSVTSIGNFAFSGCSGLTNVTIGSGVTSISAFAFDDCTSIKSITIPDSVTSIGIGAFTSCSGLTSITIPNSVTSIGKYAFNKCTGLTSCTIGSGVTSIDMNAFDKCPKLTVYVQSEQTANLVRQSGFEGNIQYVNNQGMHESMRQNRLIEFISKKILNNLINEVRYIDTKENKYNGRVTKTDWKDIYNQEPIKNNDRIRVYHGCTLKTALDWALHGTSGREWHPRTYSYESGMNPLGIFVTVDFEKAKDFGYDNECKCIVEFTAIASDLESPVWNGSDSYFGQGSNPQPFKNKEERNAQKAKYDADARNINDYFYWDHQDKKEKTISYDHVRQSDKPAMAKNIFHNTEHQALFMGNLNPNMIKRIWINQREDGKDYVSSDKTYVPLTVKEFVKKYKDHEFYVDGSYGNEKRKLTTNKLYKPNEDFKGWQDFIKRDKWLSRKEKYAQEFLKDLKSGNDYIKQSVSDMMFPKQIIQAFGQEFFDTNYNRLGQ